MRRTVLIFLLLVFLFTGCTNGPSFVTKTFYAMNTLVSVTLGGSTEGHVSKVFEGAEQLVSELEAMLSATVEDSEINKMGELSEETEELMTLALDVAKNTDGAYDPTCKALTELWNITNGGYLPSSAEIEKALEEVDYTAVTLENGVLSSPYAIDLGGAAKGYALGKTVEYLKKTTEYGKVSFGGNVGVFGKKPNGKAWEIGIKDPFDTSSVIGYISSEDEGYVAVSGDYERFFEKDGVRYHHIFDPQSGYPVDNGVHSVAVYTETAALGDILSTALFVMGYEDTVTLYEKNIYDFEALFVTDEGIKMTKGMEEIFINEN